RRSVPAAGTYGVDVGDELALDAEAAGRTPLASGIYQDVTNGGMTAKMQGTVPDGAEAYTIFADVSNGESVTAVADRLNDRIPEATTIPVAEYVKQTFASVSEALRSAAIIAIVFGIVVAVLITALFLRLVLRSEEHTSELQSR